MTAQLARAYEHCGEVARASGSTFYSGMRLVGGDRRSALFAVYALARRIDDIGDGAWTAPRKLASLAELRDELHSLDAASDPVLVAVADAASRYPIPLDAFDDLLDGVESDVRGTRFETFPELEQYCRRVAGSIGRLCLGVFDTAHRERAEPLADDLGVALQLGNILRDLPEDLERGRVYLPHADLERFGCRLAGDRIDGDVELLVAFEAQRALGWLRSGLELVALLDRRSARCVLALTAAYRRLIERIADEPARPLRGRARLPAWEKRLLVARSLARGRA